MKTIVFVGSALLLAASSLCLPPGSSGVLMGIAPSPPHKVDTGKFVWDSLSHAEKKTYMKKTVAPKMEALFANFDKKRFGKMNCTTCHGTVSALTNSFKMPNSHLPKLPSDPDSFRVMMANKKEIANFMMTKVKPQMAKLLHLPEYNIQTKTGFGCFNCHTKG